MSRIHVNRDRQTLGQFSPEEVAEGLKSGRFLSTDLAWRDGMETWMPLASFTDLPEVVETQEVPGEEAPEDLEPVGEPLPLAPDWERSDEVGIPRGLLVTIRQVITNPVVTFRTMRRTGGFLWPLTFSYCLSVVCGLVNVSVTLGWLKILPASYFPHLGENPMKEMLGGLAISVPAMLMGAAISPFFMAGIYFLITKLLTAKEPTYEALFRAQCYVSGALSIVFLIPYPPVMAAQMTFLIFAQILSLAYLTFAHREIIGVTTPVALLITVIPMLIGCMCLLGVAVMSLMSGQGLQSLGG